MWLLIHTRAQRIKHVEEQHWTKAMSHRPYMMTRGLLCHVHRDIAHNDSVQGAAVPLLSSWYCKLFFSFTITYALGPPKCISIYWGWGHLYYIRSLLNNADDTRTVWYWYTKLFSTWSQWHSSDVIMSAMSSQVTSIRIVYSTVYSGADQRKHQSSASLVLWGEFTGDRWIPRTKAQ